MCIGEAPGADEDAAGIPFCGRSGKLLDTILKSINLSRDENAYITNSLFWRPPENRRPTLEEINICRPLVEKHIALVKPKLILLVGSTAAESVLKLSLPMKTLRGQTYQYTSRFIEQQRAGAIPTVVIFHPSYLLRQTHQKERHDV